MQKKVKFCKFQKPLNKLTREPSLKILTTEKEQKINKKRNISIDFSITPFKSQKKIIKRNVRKNSFNNFISNQTESIDKTRINNNLSYMPSRKLLLNKNISLLKKNLHLLSKNKFNIKNKNNNSNKSFNFNANNSNIILHLNQTKISIIKKNSKNLRINTRSFLQGIDNLKKNFKTVGTFKNNNINNYNTTFILNKNKFPLQLDNLNDYKIIPNKTKLIINKKNLNSSSNTNTHKKIKKNNKKNLSTNFKISSDDFLKIIKNSKNKYNINKGITPPLKEKHHSLTFSNKNISNINDDNIKLLCENVKLKRKNEELITKINHISKEFNEIKKDNNDIKEELKEKNNILNNIKLTMYIFNQELIRIKNQIKTNKNSISKNNKNNHRVKISEKVNKLNIKAIEINENNEKTPSTGLGYTYNKKKLSSNELKLMSNSKNIVNLECNENNSLTDENNTSIAENLNINVEEYKKALNKCQNDKFRKLNNINNLNLISQNKDNEICSDFNHEFLKNIDNFSESWRKEVEKMMKRTGNNK